MAFCDIDDVIPKNLLAVIPEKYRSMPSVKLNVGDEITLIGATIVSYKAKKNGEFITRQDGTNVFNQSVYLELDNGTYAYVKSDVLLVQIAKDVGWTEHGESEDYYRFDKPRHVKIVQKDTKIGKKNPIPIKLIGIKEIE